MNSEQEIQEKQEIQENELNELNELNEFEEEMEKKTENQKQEKTKQKNPPLIAHSVRNLPLEKHIKIFDIFSRAIINRKVKIHINNIGHNLKENIEKILRNEIEGKCIKEGYIKKDSIKIMTYSSGLICQGVYIEFEVIFETLVCYPVEGMLIECDINTITKAGIKAEIKKYMPTPLVIFIARDHYVKDNYFLQVKENDHITVRVIGKRFELNDKHVSVIAELVKPRQQKDKQKRKKPLLVLED